MNRLLIASVCLLGLSAPASAQNLTCGERSAIVEKLKSKYGETQFGLGIGRENSVVEIFTSETTGTWTILMTLPTGMTCMMAAGSDWRDGLPPPGDPA